MHRSKEFYEALALASTPSAAFNALVKVVGPHPVQGKRKGETLTISNIDQLKRLLNAGAVELIPVPADEPAATKKPESKKSPATSPRKELTDG
jgi:hypothetical protein